MNNKMDLFAGLCVIESESHTLKLAELLVRDLEEFKDKINFSFKASFDKANRTSIDAYRGPGLEEGLKILQKVKDTFSIPLVTDFHYPEQADAVASVVDTLQIPAFLCRQTDLIVAGAKAAHKYDRQLNIKKGQFLSPEDTGNIVKKAQSELSKDKILLTERGTSFGYNNLVVDMASFSIMKQFGVRTIHDATHCVQRPGGLGNATAGKREQIVVLARAAIAAGADGIFLETHTDPANALSDATSCIPIGEVKGLIRTLLRIKEAI